MHILIAGGTGTIGRRLVQRLTAMGHAVTLLSRSAAAGPAGQSTNVNVIRWDGLSGGEWNSALSRVDGVVNLSGESIGSNRWTKKRKHEILETRVLSTRALVSAMRESERRPTVLVNASAVGFYGNVSDAEVAESSPMGSDFLSSVCASWEQEALTSERIGVRVVLARSGLVLDGRGGALPRFVLPFRLFIGGPLGSGRQWVSWIHIDDEVEAIVAGLMNPRLSGPVNLVAPEPVRMQEFCRVLGNVLHRPYWAPVPSFVLRVALGEMADELVLGGQRVVPRILLQEGYSFRFPTLWGALSDLLA